MLILPTSTPPSPTDDIVLVPAGAPEAAFLYVSSLTQALDRLPTRGDEQRVAAAIASASLAGDLLALVRIYVAASHCRMPKLRWSRCVSRAHAPCHPTPLARPRGS